MKAGIVSLFGTFNYGNRLQNYAVQEILRNMGLETEVIYIQNPKTQLREVGKKIYFSFPVRLFLKPGKSLVSKYKRQRKFEKFNSEYIKTRCYYSVNSIKEADYYVLGSDQVWNPKRYDAIKKECSF